MAVAAPAASVEVEAEVRAGAGLEAGAELETEAGLEIGAELEATERRNEEQRPEFESGAGFALGPLQVVLG